MKKWVFWLVIVILLVYEAIEQHSAAVKDNQSKVDDKAYVVTSPGKDLAIKVTKDQIYQGNLVLINTENPVHQVGIQSDVVNLFQHKELVKGFGLLDNTIRLSKSVVQSFTTMISAAEIDGVTSFYDQQWLPGQ